MTHLMIYVCMHVTQAWWSQGVLYLESVTRYFAVHRNLSCVHVTIASGVVYGLCMHTPDVDPCIMVYMPYPLSAPLLPGLL